MNVVLSKEVAVFLLESSGAMMLLLVIDVPYQVLELAPADREISVAPLPIERTIMAALSFDPRRGSGLNLFEEARLGDSPRQPIEGEFPAALAVDLGQSGAA